MSMKDNVSGPDNEPTVNTGRSASDRWTKALTKNGWTPVSDDFLRLYGELYPQISTGEAMFIIQLLSYKWDKKMPRPGFKTIAKRMGISDTQARSYARNLENNKYLTRVKRVGQTNRFDLTPLFKILEKEALAHPKPNPFEDDL